MIAARPEEQSERAEWGAFPEVPSHLPVLPAVQGVVQERAEEPPATPQQQHPQPQQQQSSSALPPIPPVEIPTTRIPESRRSPTVGVVAVESPHQRDVDTPAPDYSILYSQQPPVAAQAQPQPQVQQSINVIEAYPVLPEEQSFSYSSGTAAVVQAQPYRASNVTATTTSTNNSPYAASATRRSPRDDEERKEYNRGSAPNLGQALRNFMHEIGDVLTEAADELAGRSSVAGSVNGGSAGRGHIARRILMPHRAHLNAAGRYDVYVTMHQPHLVGTWSTPQGARPRELLITTYSNEREAEVAALAHAPPRWDGPSDRNTCTICNKLFTLMRRPHHCRNCGHYVCSSCSHKSWPSSMLPSTYHNAEKKVRTCNGCQFLMETFRDALKHGDYELARQTYESGNVNLHCPNEMERGEYPIHFAAQGGNLMIMRWLIEEQMCALRDPLLPLLTGDKMSVLAVAAMYGQTAIMHYLVHQHGCKIIEITDTTVLQRALHIIVDAPGDPPPLPLNRGSSKKRRGSTRRISTIGNSDFAAQSSST